MAERLMAHILADALTLPEPYVRVDTNGTYNSNSLMGHTLKYPLPLTGIAPTRKTLRTLAHTPM